MRYAANLPSRSVLRGPKVFVGYLDDSDDVRANTKHDPFGKSSATGDLRRPIPGVEGLKPVRHGSPSLHPTVRCSLGLTINLAVERHLWPLPAKVEPRAPGSASGGILAYPAGVHGPEGFMGAVPKCCERNGVDGGEGGLAKSLTVRNLKKPGLRRVVPTSC